MLMLGFLVLIVALMSSTAEGRREARQRMARYNRPLWIATGLIWAALFLPLLFSG
jgi:hypothetical protein